MNVTGRLADKLMFTTIYLAAALLIVWGAGRITNYALDANFYHNYLLPWQMRLLAMRQNAVKWPVYVAHDPMGYMKAVTRLMITNGVQPPKSNTAHDHAYRLRKFGNTEHQILLVYRDHHLVIYGLPQKTFDRLDRFVDGRRDPARGDFTGRWSADRISRIGYLKI